MPSIGLVIHEIDFETLYHDRMLRVLTLKYTKYVT